MRHPRDDEARDDCEDHGHGHEHEGEGGAERPVRPLRDLVVDGGRHHVELRAADEDRRRVGVHRQDEAEHRARHDARHGERDHDLHEGGERSGPEIESRFLDAAVDALHHALQRDDHERQQHRGQADDHGSRGVEDRAGGEPQCHEDRVHHAAVAEHHHPAGRAHRVPHEQRQHHENDERALEPGVIEPADVVGERQRHHETQRRRHK